MDAEQTCASIKSFLDNLKISLQTFNADLQKQPIQSFIIAPKMQAFFTFPMNFEKFETIRRIRETRFVVSSPPVLTENVADLTVYQKAFAAQALSRLQQINLGTNVISCLDIYVDVILPVQICLHILKGESSGAAEMALEGQQRTLLRLKGDAIAGLKASLKTANIVPNTEDPIQTDINRLLQEGEKDVVMLAQIELSKQSLDSLNSSKFNNFFGNNMYFDFAYSADGPGHITVKQNIYGLRQFKDIAALLQATLAKNQGMIDLEYPAGAAADPALVKLLEDMNANFKYIEPRLNMNLSSLFSPSAKTKAIKGVLNPVKALHAEEEKQSKLAQENIIDILRPLETQLNAARKAYDEKKNETHHKRSWTQKTRLQ